MVKAGTITIQSKLMWMGLQSTITFFFCLCGVENQSVFRAVFELCVGPCVF